MSIVLTKSSLSLVVSLQTSCSLATCFLIRLTSTYLPHQMAPFSCLCLARIYEHFHVSRLEHGWAHPSLRLCTGINRRGPNSLIELGRAVFLHHFAPFFCLHLGGGIQILYPRNFVSLSCLQNSSQIFQVYSPKPYQRIEKISLI